MSSGQVTDTSVPKTSDQAPTSRFKQLRAKLESLDENPQPPSKKGFFGVAAGIFTISFAAATVYSIRKMRKQQAAELAEAATDQLKQSFNQQHSPPPSSLRSTSQASPLKAKVQTSSSGLNWGDTGSSAPSVLSRKPAKANPIAPPSSSLQAPPLQARAKTKSSGVNWGQSGTSPPSVLSRNPAKAKSAPLSSSSSPSPEAQGQPLSAHDELLLQEEPAVSATKAFAAATAIVTVTFAVSLEAGRRIFGIKDVSRVLMLPQACTELNSPC